MQRRLTHVKANIENLPDSDALGDAEVAGREGEQVADISVSDIDAFGRASCSCSEKKTGSCQSWDAPRDE